MKGVFPLTGAVGRSTRVFMLGAFAFVVAAIAFSAPVAAQTGPPWDGTPVSPGLGPTYGEEWCAPVGSENVPQGAPLAILPYGAIRCTLEQFETEAAAAGVPDRLDVSVIGQSELGRDMFGVVVNALAELVRLAGQLGEESRPE